MPADTYSEKSNRSRVVFGSTSRSSGWLRLLFIVILVVSGGAVYSNTLDIPFYFDDYINIVNDPHIRLNRLSWESILSLSNAHEIERPFSMFTFALNYLFGQSEVFGYHLVNLTIHILAGLILFQLVRVTLIIIEQLPKTSSISNVPPDIIAFFSALIWMAHPLHTQSVTYIVQRENSMAAMFYILSLLLYVIGRISQRELHDMDTKLRCLKILKPYLCFAGCFLAGLLAMASKENAATLPFFILLYEWFFFQNLRLVRSKQQLFWIALFLVMLIIIPLIYLGKNPFNAILYDYAKYDFSMMQRLLSENRVIIYYLSLIFFPHPSRLNLDYDYPASLALFHPPSTIFCFLAISGMVGWALIRVTRERIPAFCILWFFGNLAIESSFIPLALIFEHRTYLPSMLFTTMMVILCFQYIRPRVFAMVLLSFLIMTELAWTYHRNEIWKNDIHLWEDCAKKSPQIARPYYNLGLAFMKQKKLDHAIFYLKKAAIFKPPNPIVPFNLGVAYQRQGNTDSAISAFEQAIMLDPDYFDAHLYIGNALLKKGRPGQAVIHFKSALSINPDSPSALNSMGEAFLELNEPGTAIDFFKQTLQLSPDNKKAHSNLGNALMKKNRFKEAIFHFKEILKDDPDHAGTNINMGVALTHINNIDAAIIHYQTSLKTAPDIAEVHNNLGVLLVEKTRYDLAKPHFEAALQLRPGYASARANLNSLKAILDKQQDMK